MYWTPTVTEDSTTATNTACWYSTVESVSNWNIDLPSVDYEALWERTKESARNAARLVPKMLKPQVVGHIPLRRPIRRATPAKFSFYQGTA